MSQKLHYILVLAKYVLLASFVADTTVIKRKTLLMFYLVTSTIFFGSGFSQMLLPTRVNM